MNYEDKTYRFQPWYSNLNLNYLILRKKIRKEEVHNWAPSPKLSTISYTAAIGGAQ